MLAAEMPKRRPSFRTQLSRSSRISDSFTDRDQLLANTSEELDGGKTRAEVALQLVITDSCPAFFHEKNAESKG